MTTNAHADAPRDQRVLDIFRRHLTAFESGDLQAVLSDFGTHSVVIAPDGIFEGLTQIRTFYQGLLADFGVINQGDSPGFTFETIHVRHDTLFITWHAESMRRVYGFGTDTFVCKGDRFELQSIAYSTPQLRIETNAGDKP